MDDVGLASPGSTENHGRLKRGPGFFHSRDMKRVKLELDRSIISIFDPAPRGVDVSCGLIATIFFGST